MPKLAIVIRFKRQICLHDLRLQFLLQLAKVLAKEKLLFYSHLKNLSAKFLSILIRAWPKNSSCIVAICTEKKHSQSGCAFF